MKEENKILRIVLNEQCYTELFIMAMRQKIDVHDYITDLLEKHVNRKKEPSSV